MAFRIEDLMFSITTTGENEAVMRLEGCDDLTMEVLFASCGMTQHLPCNGDLNLANVAEGIHIAFRPKPENLQILEEELEDALAAIRAVQAALAPPAPASVVDDEEDDDESFTPLPDLGDGGDVAPLTMSDGD